MIGSIVSQLGQLVMSASEASLVLPEFGPHENRVLFYVFCAALIALLYGVILVVKVMRQPAGPKALTDVADAIEQGSMAYLKQQSKIMGIFVLIVFVTLLSMYYYGTFRDDPKRMELSWGIAVAFVAGVICSYGAGFVGMKLAVKGNVRTANAALTSFSKCLRVSFDAGAVSGMFTVGFGLLGATIIFVLFKQDAMKVLIGFGFGGSLAALFMRVGGGIYTKAADVGADLVGKVEAGIPEDDPRNPAVIADNVGDNVGDCAGMAADLYETYVVTVVAAMLLAFTVSGPGSNAIVFPMVIGGVSIIASVIGTYFVRLGKGGYVMGALYKGLIVSGVLAIVAFWPLAHKFMAGVASKAAKGAAGFAIPPMNIFLLAVIGVALTGLIVAITEYFTSKSFNPVKSIAKASTTGHGTNVIQGLAMSMKSTAAPVIVIVAAILAAFHLGGGLANPGTGLYAIALTAVAMLSMTGIVVAIDSYGPITDNAGGIAEMSELPQEIRDITDPLDAVGNTTKAVTKGYAIGSAGLAALVLFAEYSRSFPGIMTFDLSDPRVIAGLFIGGLLPYFFAALCMEAVGKAAGGVVA